MRLDCLFYTSPASLIAFLRTEAARSFAGDLYIELSTRPALAFTLNRETPVGFPGLAGLLGGLTLADLSLSDDRLPAKLVPAPSTPIDPAVLRDALGLLPARSDKPTHITLLVPVGEVATFGATLHQADRFAIAWDANQAPENELVDFARRARAEGLIDAATFAGLLPYSIKPLDAQGARHASRLARLFAETAPHATAAHPELILPGA
jgi:hypothetical protein